MTINGTDTNKIIMIIIMLIVITKMIEILIVIMMMMNKSNNNNNHKTIIATIWASDDAWPRSCSWDLHHQLPLRIPLNGTHVC